MTIFQLSFSKAATVERRFSEKDLSPAARHVGNKENRHKTLVSIAVPEMLLGLSQSGKTAPTRRGD